MMIPRASARLVGLAAVAVIGLAVPAGSSAAVSGSAGADRVPSVDATSGNGHAPRPVTETHGPSVLGGHLCEDNGPKRDV